MIVVMQFLAVFQAGEPSGFIQKFDAFDIISLSLYILPFTHTYVIFNFKKINIIQITRQMCRKPHEQGGVFDR